MLFRPAPPPPSISPAMTERYLRTVSPPVLAPLAAVDQLFVYAGVLRTPPRPLAATSISSLGPRYVFVHQTPQNSPTIIILESRAELAGKCGIPRAYLPPNSTYALSLYWRMLFAAQHAVQRGAPVDMVAGYRAADFQFATVGYEPVADADCRVGENGEGLCFQSAVGESVEAFFARKIRGAKVIRLREEDVRVWIPEKVGADEDSIMELDLPRVAPTRVALPLFDVSRPSRKRQFQDAGSECRKLARFIEPAH